MHPSYLESGDPGWALPSGRCIYFEPCRTPEERRKKTNVFLMGGVLERREPQGLHTSRILSALCLMQTGLTDTHALALPHLRLPDFFPLMFPGLGPRPLTEPHQPQAHWDSIPNLLPSCSPCPPTLYTDRLHSRMEGWTTQPHAGRPQLWPCHLILIFTKSLSYYRPES